MTERKILITASVAHWARATSSNSFLICFPTRRLHERRGGRGVASGRFRRAISAGRRGGHVGGKAVELGEGVVHLWVGLGVSEADTAGVGNGGELRNSLVVLSMA